LENLVNQPSIANRSLLTRTLSALSALSLLAIAGCNGSDDNEGDEIAAELAIDASDSSQAESSLLAAALDGTVLGQISATPMEISAAINARLSARFSPTGCATSSASGVALTITFDNCTGPRGLRQVDGTMTLTVTAASLSSIALTAKTTNLQLGEATLSFETSATYAMRNGTATLAVDSTASGIGPFGHELEHSGDFQSTWDASCTSVEGDWSTARDGRERSLRVDVSRCAGACATGTVTRTTRDGRTITITLDGSVAVWTSTTGRNGTFALRCSR
jgi:hypothetical protein